MKFRLIVGLSKMNYTTTLQSTLFLTREATREILIRRVTFDLTGLPPTLKEVDAFVKDKSPDAYEKVVDRLLSTKAYAERMTLHWMEVAR